MHFLKYDVIVNLDSNESKKEIRGRAAAKEIGIKTCDYNTDHPDVWFFVRSVAESSVSIGAIVNGENKSKYFEDFAKTIGIDIEKVFINEISFSRLLDMLRHSFRNDYIEDDDDFIGHFDLLNARNLLDGFYGENIFESISKRLIMHHAEKIHSDTLDEELNRIYVCKKSKTSYGHPVHYMIEAEDKSWRKEAFQTLLQALYEQGRVFNKRYCYMNVNTSMRFNENDIDSIYRMNSGGTVVVRFEENNNEDSDIVSAMPNEVMIESVCSVIKSHRNDVLTVFELPCECKAYMEILADYLSDITFVEIKETLLYGENAKDFLKESAKKAGISANDGLFKQIDGESGYYAYELRNFFDEWYSQNLKTTVFPAYKTLVSCANTEKSPRPKGNAYNELNEMIGLDNAKKVIKQAVDYFKVQKIFGNQSIVSDRPAMHMVFTGNPGTAKTSVARLFAKIMKENGLVSKGQMIEVGRADLVGRYVGWTAQIVKKKFKEAIGGMLFIDEAYSLATENAGSYGKEAIDTIVQEMENHRNDVVTVFAGYPKEMENFLDTNPGLRSRIAFHVHFDDYTAEELCDIACLIAKKKGLDVDEEACEKLKTHFEKARLKSDFGNGRYARNVIETAKMTQASRLIAKDLSTVTEEDIHTLAAEDIVFTEEPKTNSKRKIGFCQ